MDKLLYQTLFGSHLYGTNTPTSDLDIKRIVLPSMNDLLLGKPIVNRVKKTNTAKNTKNSVDDVDQEDIPLQVFIQDFVAGQTYAIELAFSIDCTHADQKFFDHSDAQKLIKLVTELRTQFLTSNVKAMMGYVFNQANIYSFKGERLNCAREFRDLLATQFTDTDAGDDQLHDSLPDPGLKAYKENLASLSAAGETIAEQTGSSYKEFYGEELGAEVERKRDEHLAKFKALETKYPKYFKVTEYDIGEGRMRPCFTVLEKTFPWSNTLMHSLRVAEGLINKYGTRANQASESNVDWKAMMHAVRIIDEGIELLSSPHHVAELAREGRSVAANQAW
jgi:hypothetical protein